jgi:hypothetical protein
MHTLLTGWPIIDHANHNGLDNQRHNLRPGVGRNQRNARPWTVSTSRYKGVSWFAQTERWRAQIRVGGKKTHLGYFHDEVAAARAYDDAARAAFGEFAVLNLA